MSRTKRIEFANFTCKFGNKLSMLDLFDQVLFPAFKAGKFIRKYGSTEYFMVNTEIIKQTDANGMVYVGLAGKLVKNTKLKRDQIFRVEKGIIEDYDELESAPTSIFVLILNNHRLIYVKEVVGAPDLNTFQVTCLKFLKLQHKKFINWLIKENESKRKIDKQIERVTRSDLVKEFPHPDLRITPLTDKKELRDFIDQFEQINGLTIKLLPTNDEDIDNDEFWNELSDARERMNSKNATVNFTNKKDGLIPQEVYDQCQAASEMANSKINLNGYGQHGGTLRGNNDNFNLTIETDELSRDVQDAGPSLIANLLELLHAGVVVLPSIPQRVNDRIQNIIDRFLL